MSGRINNQQIINTIKDLRQIRQEDLFVKQFSKSFSTIDSRNLSTWAIELMEHVVGRDWKKAAGVVLDKFCGNEQDWHHLYVLVAKVMHLAPNETMIKTLLDHVRQPWHEDGDILIRHIQYERFNIQLFEHFLTFLHPNLTSSVLNELVGQGAGDQVRMVLPKVSEDDAVRAMLTAVLHGRVDMAELLYTPERGEQFVQMRDRKLKGIHVVLQVNPPGADKVNAYLSERVRVDRERARLTRAVGKAGLPSLVRKM